MTNSFTMMSGTEIPAVLIPIPTVAPLGIVCTSGMVKEVWDTFVGPDQAAGYPQSGEMRTLMAILRSVHHGLEVFERGNAEDDQ